MRDSRPAARSYSTPTRICSLPALLLPVVAAAGCVAYEPRPLDPEAILRDLERVELPATTDSSAAGGAATPQLTARQAAGWAVAHNPGLKALRADLGIAQAELVRAGLLPDPAIGWESMNALAIQFAGGTPHQADYVAGLVASWPVPRPGEIGAREDQASAHLQGARSSVLAAEWSLARNVHLACLDLEAVRAKLQLNARVLETARRTADFFAEARRAGGATAVQENLAGIELAGREQERIRLEGEQRAARQEVHRWLGIPPDAPLDVTMGADPFVLPSLPDKDTTALVNAALQKRPDLLQIMAEYDASEAELRLEVARQWPQLSIGTGLAIVLPFFSRWNRPAIDAAMARREKVEAEVRAAVHSLRADVHAAVASEQEAVRQVRHFEENLLPKVQESLRLTDEALRVREVTAIEILTAQRQVLDVQNNYLEARIRAARARLLLDTATGAVLADEARSHKGED
jgi:outer membrane protein TolC